MFSYRHAYHAGNHADVLKHMTLVACLNHMGQKDTGFTVVDTHAGIGTYRLDQEQARTSGESLDGIVKLAAALNGKKDLPNLLQSYLDLVRSFNSGQQLKHYPGSPWVANSLIRPQDKLKLFEVHPTDARLLERHVAGLGKGRQVEVIRKNSFESLKSLLPPVSRRALVLMDPSYELKTDYAAVAATIQDALKRFSTGTYAIWYPVIARPEAHSLARKLKTMSNTAGRPWVQVELNVGIKPSSEPSNPRATQLRASGMHIINPPFTLAAALRESLPVVMAALREPTGASWDVSHGG